MKRTLILSMSLSAALLTFPGCCPTCTPPQSGGGSVQTDAPDTKVEVGGGEGIKVDAPNVDVKVGGGDGIQVDAPGTKVDLGGN